MPTISSATLRGVQPNTDHADFVASQSDLPDLFVVGAAKSGTTALYHYFKVHPQVFVPASIKETNYMAFYNGLPRWQGRAIKPHWLGRASRPYRNTRRSTADTKRKSRRPTSARHTFITRKRPSGLRRYVRRRRSS